MNQWTMDRTDPESMHLKDIIVCPYTSTATKACIDAVHTNFTGAILIWGGAADDIYSLHCPGKNCLGSFTKASLYTSPAMTVAKSWVSGLGVPNISVALFS